MKSAWTLCAILFLATGLVGQTSTAPKPRKPKPAAATVTAADVQALKDAIASQQAALAQQQQQIRELRDELRNKDQVAQQAQTAATDAASKADAVQAQAVQQQQTVGELKNDVTDLKTNLASTVVTVQETQKNISGPPTAIHVKGVTITPGGFMAAETVYRQRALGSDINTPFNSIPMPGSSNYNTSEFFGSGRQSRVSMLVEGRLKGAKLTGYVEADFLSAGVTSNNNESNSYSLRQRQAWGQAAMDNGWSVTGGQMWSLITETKHGVDNRTEALPMTIDPQYHVGFSWARQYGLRLAKNFGNKVWFAVSAENSQATLTAHNNASNFLVGSAGVGGGLYNLNANYSFNPAPDVVAKLAFEPGFGHYEIFGVYSRFRDRVFPCEDVAATTVCGSSTKAGPNATGAYNTSKNGGGFGANARWSFANKHVDLGLHGFGGSGVGRYGTAGLPDVSVHTNGTLYLVKSLQGLGTLEFHNSKADVYFNGGAEYAGRAADYDPIQKKYVGYGSPLFSNTGCLTETGPGAGGFLPGGLSNCTADTRVVMEATAGVWFKVYDGAKEKLNWGRIQFGPQYSVVIRNTWSGAGFPSEAQGIDNMVLTSFRYYLP
ncbi:MAG: hypothetical protein ABR881_03580 [Candidatus Sulfotelmatobacter sp.]|jgi:hypothetical protein